MTDAQEKSSCPTGSSEDKSKAVTQGCGEDVHSPLPGKDSVECAESLPNVGDVIQHVESENKGTPNSPIRLLPSRISEKHTEPTYSRAIGDFISKMVSQGILLSQLCELPGMPSLYKVKCWLRDHEEFNALMKTADAACAQFYADRAVMVASASQWQTAKSDTLKVETAKWAAERLNPEKFAPKKTPDAVTDNSVTYNIFTGWEDGNEKIKNIVIDKRDPREIIEEENRKKNIVDAEIVEKAKDEPDNKS